MWSGNSAGQPTAPSRIAILAAQLLEKIRRRDAAMLPVYSTPHGTQVSSNCSPASIDWTSLQHSHCLVDHLSTDPVAGIDRDVVSPSSDGHASSSACFLGRLASLGMPSEF